MVRIARRSGVFSNHGPKSMKVAQKAANTTVTDTATSASFRLPVPGSRLAHPPAATANTALMTIVVSPAATRMNRSSEPVRIVGRFSHSVLCRSHRHRLVRRAAP